MNEAESRARELQERAAALRLQAMESTQGIAEELATVWRELNDLAKGDPELRESCRRVASDIAQLEKLDFSFDVEWLAEAKRAHRSESDANPPAPSDEVAQG